jgi:hypothetical protein
MAIQWICNPLMAVRFCQGAPWVLSDAVTCIVGQPLTAMIKYGTWIHSDVWN